MNILCRDVTHIQWLTSDRILLNVKENQEKNPNLYYDKLEVDDSAHVVVALMFECAKSACVCEIIVVFCFSFLSVFGLSLDFEARTFQCTCSSVILSGVINGARIRNYYLFYKNLLVKIIRLTKGAMRFGVDIVDTLNDITTTRKQNKKQMKIELSVLCVCVEL